MKNKKLVVVLMAASMMFGSFHIGRHYQAERDADRIDMMREGIICVDTRKHRVVGNSDLRYTLCLNLERWTEDGEVYVLESEVIDSWK